MAHDQYARDQFEKDKSRRIAKLKATIECVESGSYLNQLKVELMIAEGATFEMVNTDRRFICNA